MYTRDILHRFVEGIPDPDERKRARAALDRMTWIPMHGVDLVTAGDAQMIFEAARVNITVLLDNFDIFLFDAGTMKELNTIAHNITDNPENDDTKQ